MKNPFEWIPAPACKRVFVTALIWTFVLIVISQVINTPLRTPRAPLSIVSFELAGTFANAQAIVASWNTRSQLSAALGLGFDYLFMPSYAFAIALACRLAAGRHKGWFADLGAWLGWGVFLGAILDAIENIGLWNTLLGSVSTSWPEVTFWCASFKFALILLGIAYGFIGWILPKKKF